MAYHGKQLHEKVRNEYVDGYVKLTALSHKYKIPLKTLWRWSYKENWKKLRNDKLRILEELDRLQVEVKDSKQADIGKLLQRRGLTELRRLNNKALNPKQALRFIMQGIEIERLALELDKPVKSTPPKPNTDHLAQYFEGEIIEEYQPVSTPPKSVISDRVVDSFVKK